MLGNTKPGQETEAEENEFIFVHSNETEEVLGEQGHAGMRQEDPVERKQERKLKNRKTNSDEGTNV